MAPVLLSWLSEQCADSKAYWLLAGQNYSRFNLFLKI